MHDALVGVPHIDEVDAGRMRRVASLGDEGLPPRHHRLVASPGARIDDVIDHCEHARGIGDAPPRLAKRVQRHRAGPLVQEDAVDRDQRSAAGQAGDDMLLPELVEKAFRVGQPACSFICASTDCQSRDTKRSSIAVLVSSRPSLIQCQVRHRVCPSSASWIIS